MKVLVETIFAVGALGGLLWWRRWKRSSKPAGPAGSPGTATSVMSTSMRSSAASAPRLKIGQTWGKYELVELLGQGGMSTVYKVKETGQDRFFALKLIKEQFANDEAFRRRLEREVQVCQNLKHPNIVALEDWGEHQGTLYLALEYVDGDVLAKQIKAGGLPLAQAVTLLESLIDGLSFAHSQGVIHRDLKPDNVMVSSLGQVKIADFGLARSQDAEKITKTGHSMGTPAYFPPEQIAGAQPTAAADQYSLGIILYELLTGARPFNEPNLLKMLFLHLSEPPPSPLTHRPDLHPTIVAIVLRMLEKVPENRFANLGVVKEGLQAVARGQEWELPAQALLSPPPTPKAALAQVVPNVSPSAEAGVDDDGTMGFQFLDVESRG